MIDYKDPEAVAAEMERIKRELKSDIERRHELAGNLLLAVLRANGFDKVADVFDSIEKWYA